MKLFSLLLVLLISNLCFAATPPKNVDYFWATDSQEAQMTYEFYVIYHNYVATPPLEAEAQKAAAEQASYLFGALSSDASLGVPRETTSIEILKIEKQAELGSWIISYKYTGVIQTQHTTSFAAPLPFEPRAAYVAGVKSNGEAPCTDSTHAQFQYFWYFFNPKAYGCPLKEGIDYAYVPIKIQLLTKTKETYPEYERLVNKGEINIHLLFGMDDPSLDFNPHKSTDINASNYLAVRNTLVKSGFVSRAVAMSEFQQIAPLNSLNRIYVEELTKLTPRALLKIRFFFGDTAGYYSSGFKYMLKDAIASSSLMIYSGHSGLGEYLNINNVEDSEGFKITAPQNRYQIYFFNGCSTYPYYAGQYFDLKKTTLDPKGTQNLDIITNGLATYFSEIANSNLAVIRAVYAWANKDIKTSYQKIISSADSHNLIAINGDEDNK